MTELQKRCSVRTLPRPDISYATEIDFVMSDSHRGRRRHETVASKVGWDTGPTGRLRLLRYSRAVKTIRVFAVASVHVASTNNFRRPTEINLRYASVPRTQVLRRNCPRFKIGIKPTVLPSFLVRYRPEPLTLTFTLDLDF